MTQNILENCYDQEPRGKSRFISHSRVWKVDLPSPKSFFRIYAGSYDFLSREIFSHQKKHSWWCLLSLVTLVTRLMVHNSSFALLDSWRGERVDRDMHCTVWIETDELRSIIWSQTGHWLRTRGLCWCQGNLPSSKWPFSRGCCTEQIVNTIILLLNPWLDYCNWSLQGIPELLNCRLLVFKLKLITGWTVSASNQLLDNSRFNI